MKREAIKPWFLIAALVASMPFLAARIAFAASETATGSGAQSARASVDVAIVVPRVLQMRLLGHPAALDVTAEDIARGRITVSGSSLDLLANDRLGYALRAEIVGAAFTTVRIAGLPALLQATREAATLRMPSMVGGPRPQPVAVEYELELAADAAPGRYPWPVALTIQGL